MTRHIRLGVNIDHVATLRNARGENYPEVVEAAKIVEKSGADLLTVHVREDRRHINEKDLKDILDVINIPLNLEIAANPEMVKVANNYKPKSICFVPERRQEVTTEGGLDVIKNFDNLKKILKNFSNTDIKNHFEKDKIYKQFEVYKNFRKNGFILDLELSILASIAPPLWMLYHRLWINFSYTITFLAVMFLVSPWLFCISWVLKSWYYGLNQINVLRNLVKILLLLDLVLIRLKKEKNLF